VDEAFSRVAAWGQKNNLWIPKTPSGLEMQVFASFVRSSTTAPCTRVRNILTIRADANSWRILSFRAAGSNGFARNGTLLDGGTSACPDMSKIGTPGRSFRIRSHNCMPSILGILTSLRTAWMVPGNSLKCAEPPPRRGQ
jgi:hypothetical protein